MRYGLQMYGLNPIFLEDKAAFLKRITKAGYRYLEPCLVLKPTPALISRAWTPEELADNMPLLRSYGVSVHSCHLFTGDLMGDLPQVLDLAKGCGIRQVVLPCPAFTTEAEGEQAAAVLTEAGQQLRNAGLELLLHNDRADSSLQIGGVCAYEWLLNRCGESVGAQADVGWLLFGGTDPESFLWRNRDKVRSLHYKDFMSTESGLRETAIGTGLVDMMAVFQFARWAEIIQIADQDGSDGDFLGDMDRAAGMFRNLAQGRDRTGSTLCILDTHTLEVTELKRFDHVIEAPNWLQTDDDSLIYNDGGRIFRFRISTGESRLVDTGHCRNCNNDHVLSPGDTHLAVSHSEEGWMSQVYILPIGGGEPRLVTPNAPSYLHGWSPDGKELAYCAFRDHGRGTEVDIYAISAQGGEEWQLTQNAAFNDGPEYAPNGRHIWFNSTRSGLMQCWRMDRDGSDPRQMTFTQRNNWFPHVSPDGTQVVYLSYSRDGLDPSEHLPNMQVKLGLMNADGTGDRFILDFFGGQGSINVNSWNRDSRRLAFVKYTLEHR